jgi:hypothetical protein
MYFNEEHNQRVIDRGDNYTYIGSYKCNEVTIDNKNKSGKRSYIRVQCPYCSKEYDVLLQYFKRGDKCSYCCNSYENSFAYHIEVELGKKIKDYWDFEENSRLEINPYLIYKTTNKVKVWIWCQDKWYHGSYDITPNSFYNGSRCGYCNNKRVHPKDSFAQWAINNIDEDFMIKYWSNKNTVNPWEISPQSNKSKIWILCQDKDHHNDEGGYPTTPAHFYNGTRCPYCNPFASHRVHKLDSFGYLYPEKVKYWSENNKKSPFEVAPKSRDKYKFICQECGKEFERILSNLNRNNTGVYCADCNNSELEETTKQVLQKYNIKYEREKEFEKLIGGGNKPLRYDFYLPDCNLLIELQGIQHEEWQKTWMSKERFERQLEHDKRKREYAKQHNIKLLEIWYYDMDNIEQILTKQLNLI